MQRISLIIVAAISIASTPIHAGNLSVRAERPDWYKLLHDISSWNIVIEGEIDSGAPARVADALKKAGKDGADIFINSPGGNVYAAMQIGRLIRQAGASTHIGSLVSDPSAIFPDKPGIKHISGYCLRACSLGFLGGVYRYATKESKYGVHRFSSKTGPTNSDMNAAQIISATVSSYIREMDVEPDLFDLIVQEAKDDIRIVSNAELVRLNVINNGRKKAEWSIEILEGRQYLRGVQDTKSGLGKAVLVCGGDRVDYLSFYLTGSEKAKSIASGGWYHSLLIAGETVALTNPLEAKATSNEISMRFSLSRDQAMAISSSPSMGHAMQLGRDAPTFVGYTIDIPPSSSQKVGTFIRNCFIR